MTADGSDPPMRRIDSHVHLDHIRNKRPERIAWMKEHEYFPVSWAFGLDVESVSDLRRYLAAQAATIKALNKGRLPCRFLTGVHPRNIVADLKPEAIRELLMPYLESDLCLGVGEIGLETGSSHEIEVLQAHLELGPAVFGLDKVFGIHTPRRNKPEITRKILEQLRPYRDISRRIVVDHCMPETIGEVLAGGFWAGITISPVKAKVDDVETIIRRYPADLPKMMLNTDSGADFYEDLYRFSRLESIDGAVRDQLTRLGAARCFKFATG